jgi:hypothetical protein
MEVPKPPPLVDPLMADMPCPDDVNATPVGAGAMPLLVTDALKVRESSVTPDPRTRFTEQVTVPPTRAGLEQPLMLIVFAPHNGAATAKLARSPNLHKRLFKDMFLISSEISIAG